MLILILILNVIITMTQWHRPLGSCRHCIHMYSYYYANQNIKLYLQDYSGPGFCSLRGRHHGASRKKHYSWIAPYIVMSPEPANARSMKSHKNKLLLLAIVNIPFRPVADFFVPVKFVSLLMNNDRVNVLNSLLLRRYQSFKKRTWQNILEKLIPIWLISFNNIPIYEYSNSTNNKCLSFWLSSSFYMQVSLDTSRIPHRNCRWLVFIYFFSHWLDLLCRFFY